MILINVRLDLDDYSGLKSNLVNQVELVFKACIHSLKSKLYLIEKIIFDKKQIIFNLKDFNRL